MEMFDVNFLLQTTITTVVLVSMAFRFKGNYLVHVVTMTGAVIAGWVVFAIASPLLSDSAYVQTLTNPTLNFATMISHAFFGLTSFITGTLLAALLLLDRKIPGRSNLTAKIVLTFWILAYVVGIAFYVILHVI